MSQPLFLSTILTPVFASLRQPLSGAYRPLPPVGPGVPAASTFSESLADADDAALKRLVISVITYLIGHLIAKYLRRHPFRGVSFFVNDRVHFSYENARGTPEFRGTECTFAIKVRLIPSMPDPAGCLVTQHFTENIFQG